uniref:Reverse transcriptase domain-containing protein n=2 Tax=Labrus bergylta TaxID=56723 RepID=A0A3Q3F5N5_9LABR
MCGGVYTTHTDSTHGVTLKTIFYLFYCFKHNMNVFKECLIVPVGFTDHCLVYCSVFIKNVRLQSAYWHFNTTLLHDKAFKSALEYFWVTHRQLKSDFKTIQQWWDFGKSQIKQLCQQYTRNVTRDISRSLRDLEIEVVELQGLVDATGNQGHLASLKSKKSALANLLGVKAQGALVRSRFLDVTQMDAPSQFFFGLEKKSGQKKIFHSVRSNSGQSISDSAGIRKHAAGFYKDLYTSEFVDRPEVCESFYTGLPQVSAENNTELEAQLSLSELYSAVMSLQNGKAPGIDGLPVDFYKVFWSVLGEDLLEVLRDSLERGRLPLSCRRAVITLLPKKGDLQDLKNWRPVSLLCTDYKILSKVLASRLRQVMGSIIHTDQTYCVPGRLISDNITLIRHVLEVSGSLAVDTGLISLDQEKAFDRVEHQYLWRTLTAFGFNPCFLAKIQVLYRDIASVLKINGGLSAPFSVQRGVRQGCSLSGMLYSLAIEPLLHRLRSGLSGVRFPASEVSFKLSAYADDVIIFVNQQRDIDVLKETVILFGSISSAKVNWLKSEAVMVGEKLRGRLSLPGGLFWKSGGFKYLGVFLGNETFVSKNWEGVLEKVKGRLDKWRWLLPKMSFKGRVLVANNLVSSALWHRLTCIDPPSSLLCNIQRVLVDFFWDRLHWIPQSVLFLPKEEGGHGLVHLASRGATLRLQFLQRLLTGPADLVWRPLACCLLQRFGELGLSSSLFLMDLQQVNISSVTGFYQSVFNVWSLVNRQRQGHSHSLYWLLKEPVLFGGRFHLPDWAGPSLSGKFCSARISTLEQVVELTGPQLDCPAGLAARLGVRSTRVVDRLLKHWRHQLTGQEMSLMSDYGDGSLLPDQTDPFPEFTLSADLKDCSGPLLANAAGKTLYKLIVKTLNKKTLNARSDTPWRTYLGLAPEFRPSWESLYKPPCVRDMQTSSGESCMESLL